MTFKRFVQGAAITGLILAGIWGLLKLAPTDYWNIRLAEAATQVYPRDNMSFIQIPQVWRAMSVKDKDLATPPGSPAEGDRYIVAATGTDSWLTHTGQIAEWHARSGSTAQWYFYDPNIGYLTYVVDEGLAYSFNGSAWVATAGTLPNGIITDSNVSDTAAIKATKIGDGTVNDTEYKTLDGVTSGIQAQLNGKAPSLSGTAGKMTQWTGTSAIGDASNTDTEVASAVTQKHAHTGTGNYVPKWNGTAYIDSTMFDSGGNIGIGTTSPEYRLDIVSAVTRKGLRVIDPSEPGVSLFSLSANAGARNYFFGSNDAAYGDFVIKQSNAKDGDPISAGTVRLQISPTGNVGIGLDGAPARLTVRLSDAAGGDSLVIQDSGGVKVGAIDSDGNIKSLIAGGGLFLKEGSNCTMGAADLVSGTKTISTNKVTAASRIFLTTQSTGGVTPGHHWISTRTAATSFVIQSSVGTDTSNVSWVIIEPN